MLGMSITVMGSEPEVRFIITISPPSGQQTPPAPVTIRVEDINSVGFVDAQAKLGEDGQWQDIMDPLRRDGFAYYAIPHSGRVYVSVTDRSGLAHVSSRHIEVPGHPTPTPAPTPPTACNCPLSTNRATLRNLSGPSTSRRRTMNTTASVGSTQG